MTHARLRLLASIVCVLALSIARAQTTLTTTQAKQHVGESATVCGDVTSTRYATKTRGNPTFINLDKPYPNQVFTLLIWGSDRPKFGDPEEMYRNRRICITGKIADYKGVPEIVAYEPAQVKTQ